MSNIGNLLREVSEHKSDGRIMTSLQDLNDSIEALKEKINTQLLTQLEVYPSVLQDTQYLCEKLKILNDEIDSLSEELLKKERQNFDSMFTSYEGRILEFNNLQQLIHALELLQRLTSSQEKSKAAVDMGDVLSAILLYIEGTNFVTRISDFNLQNTNVVVKSINELDFVRNWIEEQLMKDVSQLFKVEENSIELEKLGTISEKAMSNVAKMELFMVIAKSLEQNLFKPLLAKLFSGMGVKASSSRKTNRILFSFVDKSLTNGFDLSRHLEALCTVFRLLGESFLGTTYRHTSASESETTFLKFIYVELSVGKTILDSIYNNVLKEYLPSSVLDLTNYNTDAITSCEETLYQLGLSDVSNCFESFRENIRCYFVANFVSSALCKSRELIRDNIQVTCVVGDFEQNGIGEKLISKKDLYHLPTLSTEQDKFLNSHILSCPTITISENIRELVDMLVSNVEEASQMEDLSAASEMYQCCEDVLYLFCDLVSTCNPNNAKLPFMEAVRFNNLMYVAHYCQFLGLIPACFPDGALRTFVSSEQLSFVHFSSVLRLKAEEFLMDFLQTEKLMLSSFFIDQNPIFAASNVALASSAVAQTVSPHEVLKPLEKCMFFIEERCNLWKPPVLSKNSFTLALAFLLNFVLQYVVNYCITFEDLTTSDAESLEKVLQLAQDRCSSLVSQIFDHSHSVKKEKLSSFYDSTIPEYHRLCWIKKILGLGLIEIQSQWNAPKSELKNHISSEELKKFVRALFQNTELRSQILSSIR